MSLHPVSLSASVNPNERPAFGWVHLIRGHLKTSFSSADPCAQIRPARFAPPVPFADRFSTGAFHLDTLPTRLPLTCSSPLWPSDHTLLVGFVELKRLANQELL